MAGAIAIAGTFAASLVGAGWKDLLFGLVCSGCFLMFSLLIAVHLTFAIMPWGRTEIVTVQPGEVGVERRWLVLRGRDRLTREEMQSAEVAKAVSPAYSLGFHDVWPREVVRINSPSDAIEFGGWLTHAERVWLRDTVASIACA
jgi:hypothetical protein